MLPQDDIDAVLRDAQSAVDELTSDVGQLSDGDGASVSSHTSSATAVASPPNRARAAASTVRVDRILKLRVPLIVRLAQRPMRLGTIMKMGPGTILEFDRSVEEEFDLMISNCRIGAGVAVKVKESFGLRITRIDGVKKRIDSLKASP
jgi:flagellar motor switch protein FliN/FliY